MRFTSVRMACSTDDPAFRSPVVISMLLSKYKAYLSNSITLMTRGTVGDIGLGC